MCDTVWWRCWWESALMLQAGLNQLLKASESQNQNGESDPQGCPASWNLTLDTCGIGNTPLSAVENIMLRSNLHPQVQDFWTFNQICSFNRQVTWLTYVFTSVLLLIVILYWICKRDDRSFGSLLPVKDSCWPKLCDLSARGRTWMYAELKACRGLPRHSICVKKKSRCTLACIEMQTKADYQIEAFSVSLMPLQVWKSRICSIHQHIRWIHQFLDVSIFSWQVWTAKQTSALLTQKNPKHKLPKNDVSGACCKPLWLIDPWSFNIILISCQTCKLSRFVFPR